jgi:cysteinyl-tRNA synthetase
MVLSLYNTLGREQQDFIPLKDKTVGFYGCGPTVYNFAHIGNLRAYVTHDILTRTLRFLDYSVNHVMNITDVGHLTGDDDSGDDKMVKSAEERGKSVLEVADFYTQAFFRDCESLNIVRPNTVCKATEHIDDMITMIKEIEANGYTYTSGGNLYFDISKFPSYGELARLKLDDLKAGARTDVDENKRNPYDFVLWFTKSKFENQALVWDSPWGRGYPGWHIECSAMSRKYLGDQFDIHAGGIDHIPIHHTNEIAQSEAATGKHPWVKYWVHNEFLVLNAGKMSKSDGGFITLQTLIEKGFHPLDYRFFLLGGHYRSQLQFSYEALEGAKNSRKNLVNQVKALAKKCKLPLMKKIDEKTISYLDRFQTALENDLSTPRALAELWGLIKDNNLNPKEILAAVFVMDDVLGLDLEKAAFAQEDEAAAKAGSESPELVAEIEALIEERANAKKAKDFATADRIRNELKERGILLEDSSSGTSWKKNN